MVLWTNALLHLPTHSSSCADAPGSPGHILAGGIQVTPTAPSPDIIKNEGLDEAVFNETSFK